MTFLEEIFSLNSKVALVTGAGRGLGHALAEGLLKAGAKTIMVGSNACRLNEAAEAFRKQGLDAIERCCDLLNRCQVDELVDDILGRYDYLDILVNNAGITFTHPLFDYPDESWEKTLRVNLEAPFQLVRRFAESMTERESGSIINITSLAAEIGFPDNPAYQAAKGGLRQLTKALAADLGRFGIRVNNIGPGYFRTDMTRASWGNQQLRKKRAGRTLLGRWGVPNDMMGLVILLASDASSYITGQDFYVDGGWLTKGF